MSMRPKFIKNIEQVEEESHYLDEPPEEYRTRRRLGKATGAEQLGVNYCRLRPGQVSSRFHYHTREEEFFLILIGRAVLHVGKNTYDLENSDCVSILPGGPAHQLRNDFKEECIYLVFSNRNPEDSIVYPENGFIPRSYKTSQ